MIGPTGQTGRIWFDVSVRPGNPDMQQSGFVNILLDLNQDGTWASHQDGTTGVEEWVVQNFPVSAPEGAVVRMVTPDFAYGPSSARTLLLGSVHIDPHADRPRSVLDSRWVGRGPAQLLDTPMGKPKTGSSRAEGALRITYIDTADAFPDRLSPPPGGGVVINQPGAIPDHQPGSAAGDLRLRCASQSRRAVWTRVFLRACCNRSDRSVRGEPDLESQSTDCSHDHGTQSERPPRHHVSGDHHSGADCHTGRHDDAGPSGHRQPGQHPFGPRPHGSSSTTSARQPVRARLSSIHWGPCLLQFQKVNDEPIYLQWP